MLRPALPLAAALILLAWTLPAAPASYSWNDANGGAYTDGQRWLPEGGPGDVDDTVVFDLGAEPRNRYTVTGVSGESDELRVRTDSLTLELSGDYTLPNAEAGVPDFAVGVDPGDVASVRLTGANDAVFQSSLTYIGWAAGSHGAVTATGSDWVWTAGHQIMIGWYGTGELTIEDGLSLTSASPNIGTFSGAEGSVTVRGNGSSWNLGGQMSLGVGGTATLTVESGGTVSSGTGVIASGDNAVASATIRGDRSSWHIFSHLFVGYDGDAELAIESGAAVSAGNAWLAGWVTEGFGTAEVAVRGRGSRFDLEPDCVPCDGELTIGVSNLGTLLIEDAGQVSSVDAWIGLAADGVGEVTVRGVDSRWDNAAQLFIGDQGSGELLIEDAGVVTSSDGWIGVAPDSIGAVIVRGTGAQWSNSGALFAGSEGTASLRIEDGALVSNGGVWMGLLPGSASEARVLGADAWWDVAGALRVGYSGNGTLAIEEGGAVTSTSADIAATSGSISSAVVDGTDSTWTSGTLHVGSAGIGNLTISNGGWVESTDGIIGDRGTVRIHGAGSAWVLSGSLAMEQEQQVGTLDIGFSGPTAHGVANVADAALLGGELELTLPGGGLPSALDTFTVLTSGAGVSGAFANVASGERLETSKGVGSFLVHYGPTSVFDPDHVVLSDFVAAPEPDAILAAGVALAALAWLRRSTGVRGVR